ncbi:LuxR C-terminal-related transcriptional regulator [Pedococcus sp. 5OH_020]|uniref:LuxR C-terminal-related transcriptional regulator n=1 Tax=Pedococcus sp. 5OH_020 TaxID=2989814 RepID=UPI0022E9E2D1|nr:LuxR C-terminal-related transcriptional regulator [Pedococcus sp. 5OH_020]
MAVLGTKVHVPVLRRELVARARLVAQLNATWQPRLVLLSAPAGFGKTTLLSQAMTGSGGTGRAVAWLSLDARDNDPRRFLEHVVAALATVGPFPEAASLVGPAAPVAAEAVLTTVVNELDLLPGRIVLALDDYHVIESAQVQQAVTFLLEHLPPQASLAIATRADPAVPLARLRARGELLELRADDLRFTEGEAATFLTDVMGLHLAEGAVAALEAQTEGWVAGLQLAGLSLRGVDDPARFVAQFTGTHRFVLDYLVDEVLRHQPEHVRQFLLETSVLRHMTGPLCDQLTGHGGSNEQLEALDRANVFIVALDDRREWYRYHHLFGDALRSRLTAEFPDRVPILHRAASEWFASHGLAEDAVAHALASGDPEYAADLVEAVLPDLRRERRDVMMRDWLTALPQDVVQRRPLLGTYLAWVRLVAGDLDGVSVALGDAEAALAENPPVADADASAAVREELRTLPATMNVFRASAAQARGDTAATRRHARAALQLTGPDDHMARGGALGFLGLAAWGNGDLADAVTTFTEAVHHMGAAGDVSDLLGSTVVLAQMWTGRGRPGEARRLLEQALATAQQHPGAALATLGDLHVALADVLVEQGDLDAATAHLEAASSLGDAASLLENRYRWYVTMARLRRAQGDLEGAAELLRQAEPLHLPGFFPDVRPIAAQLARLRIAQGALEDAQRWADTRAEQTPTTSYLDEFAQLTMVRLQIARHRADGDDAALKDAFRRLDHLTPSATTSGRDGSLLEISILRAMAHHAGHDVAAATKELCSALRSARQGGYVRLFLDEGKPMLDLLDQITEPPEVAEYAHTLRPPAPTTSLPPPGQAELLSDRELEVLRLLATARTGPGIADDLFVSINTLRTHTKHIFTKLDVNTRRAAVERATELGLL